MAASFGQQTSSEPASPSAQPVAGRPWSVDTVIKTGILSVLLGGVIGLVMVVAFAVAGTKTIDGQAVERIDPLPDGESPNSAMLWAAFAAHMTTWGILAVVPTRWRGFARFLDWLGVLLSPIVGLVVIGLGSAVGHVAYQLAAPAPRTFNAAWNVTIEYPTASKFATAAGVIASTVGCVLYLILPNLMQGADRFAFRWLRRRAEANARRTHA